jgi:beta-mannanase
VPNKSSINYLGIFAPEKDNGISNLQNVSKVSNQIGENFDIVSLYLAWDKDIESTFPGTLLDSIYKQKSIPLITWEPWLNSFDQLHGKAANFYDLVIYGYFDDFITRFSEKLKDLNRPVFLRYAHEFDNPFYPWCVDGDNASLKFKKAWIHVYEIFKNSGAHNVIWIWSPWGSENIEQFYPGPEYVDWIGVDILNYGKLNRDGKYYDFASIYWPFHEEIRKLPSVPVIVAEFGSLKGEQNQDDWIKKAFVSIETEFSEIKSVVYFNSKVDDNWPAGLKRKGTLDWSISDKQTIKNSFVSKAVPDYVFSPFQELAKVEKALSGGKNKLLDNVVGVNLKKGHDWRKDYHVLSRKSLLNDFRKIKNLGINTVKFEGNSVYEYNVLNIAKESDLRISYGFWVSADIDFVEDSVRMNQLEQSILKKIAEKKNDSSIISWNIQNDVLFCQKDFYLKPRILFQNRAYVLWLKKLVREIKKIDSIRPLVVDLDVNLQSAYYAKMLMDNIDGIDALGLMIKESDHLDSLMEYLNNSKIQYLISDVASRRCDNTDSHGEELAWTKSHLEI